MAELKAIYKLLKEDSLVKNKVKVGSNKGHIGHCFGAAGAIESILSILSIQEQKVLGTANLE